MEVEAAVSIDEIYERVQGHDLVLTVEAPLADSINNRVEEPFLGYFSITPRRLVYDQYDEDLMDKRELFHFIVNKTEMTWKQASYLLENAISCWMETGKLTKILEYPRFDSEEMERVVDILKSTNNIFRAMEEYELSNQEVAVVAYHQFNELDKKVLPEKYDKIEVFKQEKKELPRFNVFNSEVEIVRALSKNINKRNASDVALVMDPDSEYQALVESLLETNGIPYMTQPEITENMELRNFLSLCRLVNRGSELKLKEVQPILKSINIDVSREYNEQYLKDLELKELNEFKNLLKEIENSCYKTVLDLFEKLTKKETKEIQDLLNELDLLEKEVNEKTLDLIEFYLDVFDVPLEGGERRGVLFASPKNVAWVDRSIVFHIEMGTNWVSEPPEKPWINKEKFEEQKLKNFKILLQNEKSYYLVQDKHLNEEVTPCFYFNEITSKDYDSFTDFPHKRYKEKQEKKLEGFEKEEYNIEVEEIDTISQSSLNKFVECPRNYFFSQLVTSVDQDFFRKGNLFHDFAEFYLNHPSFTKENHTEIIGYMVGEMRPIVEDLELDLLKTEFLVGTKNIMNYIDDSETREFETEGYNKRNERNIFSEEFGKSINSEITEAWFENQDLGCHGKVDLIKNMNHLVDYKSGGKKSCFQIVKGSNLDLLEDNPNFQAMLYLAHHRNKNPNQKLEFTFYYFLENIDEEMSGESNYRDNITKITYYPKTFEEQISEKITFKWLLGSSKKRTEFLKTLGFENYQKALKSLEVPEEVEYSKGEIVAEKKAELMNRFRLYLDVGRGKDVTERQLEKISEGILKKFVEFRKSNYFKEDLDKFEEFLWNKIEELNTYKRTEFPIGDADLEKIDNRDLLIL